MLKNFVLSERRGKVLAVRQHRRIVLELRLPSLATPSRVADATAMLASVVAAGFPDREEELSVVVENRTMRVRLGAWTERATDAAAGLRDFIENPTQDTGALADPVGVAEAMERYCRTAIDIEPSFWKPRARRPFRSVDRAFIDHLHVVQSDRLLAVGMPAPLRATTVVMSVVLRVGNTRENAERRARILLSPSNPIDVLIADEIYSDFCDALKHGRLMRIGLLAIWERAPEGLRMSKRGTTAISIDDFSPQRGNINAGLATIGPVMSAEESELMYAWLGRRGEDE